jgi:hypothetical protein
MRKLIVYALLAVVALAPAAIAAIPGDGHTRPMIAYWIDYNIIPDKATQMGSVFYYTDYYLEDNTHIGADGTQWGGQTGHAGSSLVSSIANAIATGVGGMAGWNFGAWAGQWAASQVAIQASTAWYWMGLGAMAAGPWVGLAVGAALGAA